LAAAVTFHDFGLSIVMPGLVPGIHVLATKQGVDGRWLISQFHASLMPRS
jgi:hypothetical protein